MGNQAWGKAMLKAKGFPGSIQGPDSFDVLLPNFKQALDFTGLCHSLSERRDKINRLVKAAFDCSGSRAHHPGSFGDQFWWRSLDLGMVANARLLTIVKG